MNFTWSLLKDWMLCKWLRLKTVAFWPHLRYIFGLLRSSRVVEDENPDREGFLWPFTGKMNHSFTTWTLERGARGQTEGSISGNEKETSFWRWVPGDAPWAGVEEREPCRRNFKARRLRTSEGNVKDRRRRRWATPLRTGLLKAWLNYTVKESNIHGAEWVTQQTLNCAPCRDVTVLDIKEVKLILISR